MEEGGRSIAIRVVFNFIHDVILYFYIVILVRADFCCLLIVEYFSPQPFNFYKHLIELLLPDMLFSLKLFLFDYNDGSQPQNLIVLI